MDGSKSSIISIHALLAESDRSRQIIIIIVDNFYPRSPCGERLDDLQVPACVSKISIHALLAESDAIAANPIFPVRDFSPRSPCGERPPRCRRHLKAPKFLSTLSLRRATIPHRGRNPGPRFLSTLSLRRATRISKNLMTCLIFLSTLSLRRATGIPVIFLGDNAISIHALLAESDDVVSDTDKLYYVFLSTLSLRRATGCVRYCIHARVISIHALLAESDNRYGRPIDVQLVFLSTLSLRRATTLICEVIAEMTISIHALLAESDFDKSKKSKTEKHFYPRSPCGERLRGWTLNINGPIFLSTLSLRRATAGVFCVILII